MKSVLTIAGSDSSGGAGIQADIKTITAHGLFGTSVITALTAQNTMGVHGVVDVDPAFVGQQIDAVFDDIRPHAVKIGMVSSSAIVEAIAQGLRRHDARLIVVDPVMVATSGSTLMANDAVEALVDQLMPLATVVTPNIPEAEVLAGFAIKTADDMRRAAEAIAKRCARAEGGVGTAVLVKGGHALGDAHSADDFLRLSSGDEVWLRGRRIDTSNTHGTGCTLSSAIACGLAEGLPIDSAVARAKAYVAGALSAGLDLGRGNGPLNHMWAQPPLEALH